MSSLGVTITYCRADDFFGTQIRFFLRHREPELVTEVFPGKVRNRNVRQWPAAGGLRTLIQRTH